MDEPLSNLDAKLRVQMRAEISRLQRHLQVATLFVTHDQTEAMTLGDRVAIMRSGRLLQLDAPQAVYDRPANIFVAEFIGSPAMNLYRSELSPGQLRIGGQTIALPDAVLSARPALARLRSGPVVAGVRAEHLHPAGDADGATLVADVDLVEALGSDALVHFRLDAQRVHSEDAIGAELAPGGGDLDVSGEGVARVEPSRAPAVGERVRLGVDPLQLHFFDPDSGAALWE